jgi:hypothetical protein
MALPARESGQTPTFWIGGGLEFIQGKVAAKDDIYDKW